MIETLREMEVARQEMKRKAFENHCLSTDFVFSLAFSEGKYSHPATQMAWEMWQAAQEQMLQSRWISVETELPALRYECHQTGLMISNAVLISNINDYPSYGFGHMNEEGGWVKYSGEHDFMNVEKITHWQPLPQPPKQ